MIDDYDQDIFFFKTERLKECLSTRSVQTVFMQLLVHIDIVKLDHNLNIPNK